MILSFNNSVIVLVDLGFHGTLSLYCSTELAGLKIRKKPPLKRENINKFQYSPLYCKLETVTSKSPKQTTCQQKNSNKQCISKSTHTIVRIKTSVTFQTSISYEQRCMLTNLYYPIFIKCKLVVCTARINSPRHSYFILTDLLYFSVKKKDFCQLCL